MPSHIQPRGLLPARASDVPALPWVRPPTSRGADVVTSAANRRHNPEWRARLERRIRAEFTEMPGLRLSLIQAQRLFGLRRDVCERILEGLVEDGFLCNAGCALYARRELW